LTPNASTNRDSITDFNSTDDVIQLSSSIFTSIPVGTNGFMLGTALYAADGATQANDASDRIIYNKTTGALYYDKDGTGSVAAVHFATLTTKPAIIAADFLVV
jgi:Ca2+-binding RTX toxin-like protein